MTIKVNNCVGCRSVGLPCMGISCVNHSPREIVVCDRCGESAEKIYIFDGRELCEDCVTDYIDEELINTIELSDLETVD